MPTGPPSQKRGRGGRGSAPFPTESGGSGLGLAFCRKPSSSARLSLAERGGIEVVHLQTPSAYKPAIAQPLVETLEETWGPPSIHFLAGWHHILQHLGNQPNHMERKQGRNMEELPGILYDPSFSEAFARMSVLCFRLCASTARMKPAFAQNVVKTSSHKRVKQAA